MRSPRRLTRRATAPFRGKVAPIRVTRSDEGVAASALGGGAIAEFPMCDRRDPWNAPLWLGKPFTVVSVSQARLAKRSTGAARCARRSY